MGSSLTATREVLLRRQGLVFVEGTAAAPRSDLARAVGIKLAQLGYVPSTRLLARLERAPVAELTELQAWMWSVLAAKVGADQRHKPLFRKFPNDIPSDTFDLWLRKVLCHFLQAKDQPCLFCRRIGTTHVLSPCRHVVCDHCFDGQNYSACPVCEHHVDKGSPFFQPSPADERALPKERVTFKLIDLSESMDAEARALLLSFCDRRQALSPADKDDFTALLRDYGERVIPWLPASIPVKENIATVLGILFQRCDPKDVLPVAKTYMRTATDVLRFIAAFSGADPSLQGQSGIKKVKPIEQPRQWWGKLGAVLGVAGTPSTQAPVVFPVHVYRFKVAQLRRPLRRALLEVLEGLHPDRLVEDMLRHRSYWVWVGEFLHPHEYAKRFPNVARAFLIVRKKSPEGQRAPAFQGYYGKLEGAIRARDAAAMAELLRERPGELARRFDHALRLAGGDARATERVLEAAVAKASALSTPVLLTLMSFLPTRIYPASARIYWPKGEVTKGVSRPDERPALAPDVVTAATRVMESELLRRLAALPGFEDFMIDVALQGIVVPFNERTASRAAVALPRGSRIQVPPGKVARMFLHWCEPQDDNVATDIDLSVAFYNAEWSYVGVCSYYQHKFTDAQGAEIAVSAGDLRNAPFPKGATEFVDLHRDRAIEHEIRYAVMVVNNYRGLPFSRLERGFAGLMLRDDVQGQHFDPRTVHLKFDLQGENGIFLPLVFDLGKSTLHWLDVYSKGMFELNNVASSNAAITKICPELIEYFGSGVRTSMYELALLHAAARSQRVVIRGRGLGPGLGRGEGEETKLFVREPGEDHAHFLDRLRSGQGARMHSHGFGPSGTKDGDTDTRPVFAALCHGDIDLPQGSVCYAVFPEKVTSTISASDLLSVPHLL